MILHHRGFPIRKSAGQSLFPTHRSLSQVIASFIGSQCQGIHLTLFFAWTAVLLFSYLKISLQTKQIQLFCLSFANNCSLGCKLKDLLVLIHWFLSAISYYLQPTKLFPLDNTEKPFKNFFNKFFSIAFKVSCIPLKAFTTICFVSFSLFGFQWTSSRMLNEDVM